MPRSKPIPDYVSEPEWPRLEKYGLPRCRACFEFVVSKNCLRDYARMSRYFFTNIGVPCMSMFVDKTGQEFAENIAPLHEQELFA